MRRVVVLVPYYTNELNVFEKISLHRLHNVLSKYEIIYIKPSCLHVESQYEHSEIPFDDSFFSSIQSYNRLLLSEDFYSCFSNYEYILICQLDVFVVSDRMEEFCNLGYDYYGAPWLYGMPIRIGNMCKIRFVGNGGFSLRKVDKTISLLRGNEESLKEYHGNEDMFFAYHASSNYRVCPSYIASRFSIESQVRCCMERNHNILPFAFHAWCKWDYDYLEPIIKRFGYDIDKNRINCEQLDFKNKKSFFRRLSADVLVNICDYFVH